MEADWTQIVVTAITVLGSREVLAFFLARFRGGNAAESKRDKTLWQQTGEFHDKLQARITGLEDQVEELHTALIGAVKREAAAEARVGALEDVRTELEQRLKECKCTR